MDWKLQTELEIAHFWLLYNPFGFVSHLNFYQIQKTETTGNGFIDSEVYDICKVLKFLDIALTIL